MSDYCEGCGTYEFERFLNPKNLPIGSVDVNYNKDKLYNKLMIVAECGHWKSWHQWRWLHSLTPLFGVMAADISPKAFSNLTRLIFRSFTESQSHVARYMVDVLKAHRNYELMRRAQFDWERDLPKETVDWAWKVIKELGPDDSCQDNYRVAIKSKRNQRHRYNKLKAHGCCGYWDEEFVYQGETYMIGLNYGH